MNEATVDCDTIQLKNNYNLYWQFNCDKIWLTLEKPNKSKITIDVLKANFYAYTYRLGYQLIEDYPNTILFKSGCLGTGPCKFTLINKKNGKKIKEYYEQYPKK
ncbi:hypothetical protein [Flavobacterium branchiicola]|uniref:GLPGLI family protein n=1 Tax=Flavobacterium branchiicola TaxID=1114875 RepID=A0ABV9PFR1_9FLAO|nr:hypothetical protein [Flavobacterium branchiicola]MBS7254676.1 hypothetical protein [Flavobacterium branchiicola]